MKILVIIVTYDGMRWVERCFGSLRSSKVPVDCFVVDNGSTDGTVEWIRTNCPEAHLVVNAENTGFGAANNLGMRYAMDNGYDYAYLLNQDAWIFPDTIGKLVEANKAAEEYALLSPVQMYDGLTGVNRLFESRVYGGRTEVGEDLWSVPFVMAAHWLISRKCLATVGLFAPLFHFYGEDDNYCSRVLFHGFKIGVVPSAKAVHDIGGRKQPRERYIFRCIFTYSLHLLSDPRRNPFLQLLYIIPYSVYSCFKFRSFLPLKYMCGALKEFPAAIATRRISMGHGAFMDGRV